MILNLFILFFLYFYVYLSFVLYTHDSTAIYFSPNLDLIKFDRPAPATVRSPRPVDPRLTILLFSLTLLPLIKVIFPFWTYFDVGPFEKADIVEEISSEMSFLEEPILPNKIDVLVMINSKINEVHLREDIRKSWGNSSHFDPEMTSVVFVLARPSTEEESKLLGKEIQKYGDLLVTDLEEGYYSLSLKTYAMVYYKWKRFPRAKCLVKADSDNVLHLFNYELLCEETRGPVILGNCDVEQRVKRKNSKWAVPYELYGKPYWPRYCSTGTYVFCGKDVPKRIIEAAKDTPFFNSVNYRRLPEDVLFTGLFAEVAKLRRKTVPGISFRDQPVYKCRDVKYTYSIHMHRRKDPIYYYRKLLSLEGGMCFI